MVSPSHKVSDLSFATFKPYPHSFNMTVSSFGFHVFYYLLLQCTRYSHGEHTVHLWWSYFKSIQCTWMYMTEHIPTCYGAAGVNHTNTALQVYWIQNNYLAQPQPKMLCWLTGNEWRWTHVKHPWQDFNHQRQTGVESRNKNHIPKGGRSGS